MPELGNRTGLTTGDEESMKAIKQARRRGVRVPLPFREGPITFEEYIELVPDGVKADLIDGVIYMASPDNTDANDLNGWLCVLLYGYVDAKDLGKVYVARVTYRLGPKRGP